MCFTGPNASLNFLPVKSRAPVSTKRSFLIKYASPSSARVSALKKTVLTLENWTSFFTVLQKCRSHRGETLVLTSRMSFQVA